MASDFPSEAFTLHLGDARDISELLSRASGSTEPEAFLQATVTSPPYGRLVDYGVTGQIGHGQREAEYLADCQAVFKTLFEWTRDSGVMWLVVDSYLDQAVPAGQPSRMEPLPFTMAQIAEQVGWTLREVVIWRKDRTRPWSHHGKLRNRFEYVLLLVKSKHFPFNVDRLREADDLTRWWVQYPERYHAQGKAPDNVWDIPIPVQGSWSNKAYNHACPLPVELVRRVLELTTSPGDVVCDPFGGIGTVVATAAAMGRSGLGTELNPEFVAQFEHHVETEVRELVSAHERKWSDDGPSPETVAALRALKFPKALYAAYRRVVPELPQPRLAVVDIPSLSLASDGNTLTGVTWIMVMDADADIRDRAQRHLKELASRSPLNKFGVIGDIRVVESEVALRVLRERDEWFRYEHGRTWQSAGSASPEEALTLTTSERRGRFIPIVGSHLVSIDLDLIGDPAVEDPRR